MISHKPGSGPALIQDVGDITVADLLRAIDAINGFVYRCINDSDWTLKFMSAGVEELSGHPAGAFLHDRTLTWAGLIHREDAQRVWDEVQAGLDERRRFEIAYRIIARDGSVRWVHERGCGIYDDDGGLLFLDGHIMDATPLVEANESLRIKDAELERLNQGLERLVRERTEELRESEQQLQRAQEIASLGHWTVNVQTGDLQWSDQIYRIFGYQPGAFNPDQASFYDSVHPDDVALVRRFEHEAFASGRAVSVDHRIVLPDGSIRWVHEEAVSESDEDGRPLRMTGTVQDISERKQIEAELVRAREAAERASQAKSGFLSRMSHELRTPMNAILGFAQLLEGQVVDPGQADNVREIMRAGHHLLDLINEVLDLSSIESGRLALQSEQVAVIPVIEACLETVRPLAEQAAITLRTDLRIGRSVQADPQRLRQVLLNLLSNAIKYNRSGGEVTVQCDQASPERLAITVIDSGSGIAPDSLSRIYQPFERLEAIDGDIPGTGVGLTLCKLLIEAMHGSIDVDSTPGVGSRFRIELPVLPDEWSAATGGGPAPAHEPECGPVGKLLYIEDNPANMRLVQRILDNHPGWQVIEAADAESGIARALSDRPDLILMDISLPGLDGYAALQRLRAEPATAAIPVIALSANAMPADIRKGRAAGFDDYLTKPIDVRHFLSLIGSVLATVEERR